MASVNQTLSSITVLSEGNANSPSAPADAALAGLRGKLDALRRRVRRLVWLGLLSRLVLAFILLGGLLICVDAVVRPDSRMVRGACSGLLLAVLVRVAVRYGVIRLGKRTTDVQLAAQVQRRYPFLDDQLASALELATEERTSPLAHSVIREADRRARHVDFRLAVDRRHPRRLATVAALGCVAAGLFAGNFPDSARIAGMRLLAPWSTIEWPRRVELELLGDDGQPLRGLTPTQPVVLREGVLHTFRMKNTQGPLPDDARLIVARENGEADEVPALQNTAEGDSASGTVRLRVTSGEFRVRPAGGDDTDAEWVTVQGVVPPRLEQQQIRIVSPQYLGEEPRTVSGHVPTLRTWAGSMLRLTARSTSRLDSAVLVDSTGQRHPVEMNTERKLSAELVIGDSLPLLEFWWELKANDNNGFFTTPRTAVRVLADNAPTARIRAPAAGETFTPTALLTIDGQAADDVALRTVRTIVHYKGSASDAMSTPNDPPAGAKEHLLMEEVDLSEREVQVGDQIGIVIEAVDNKPSTPPQQGRSEERVVRIVSAEAKRAELISEQLLLLDDLGRVQTSLRDSTRAVEALAVEVREIGSLASDSQRQLDRLAARHRTNVVGPLTGTRGSVLARLTDISIALMRNRIDTPEFAAQVESVTTAVQEWTTGPLHAVTQRHAQLSSDPHAAPVEGLEAIVELQTQVLSELDRLLDRHARWHSREGWLAEVEDLADAQRGAIAETDVASRETVGRALEDLTPDARVALGKAAVTQDAVAEAIESLRRRLGQPDSETTPETDALRQRLEASGLAERLRTAAADLRENRIGEARAAQAEALDELETLSSLLQAEAERPVGDRLETLRKLADEAETLHKRQVEHLSKPPATESERSEFADEVDQLAKQTEEAGVSDAARALARAANGLRGDAQDRARQEEAHEDLSQATRELRKAVASEEQRRAAAEFARLWERLPELSKQQAALADRIEDVRRRYDERGSWSRSLSRDRLAVADNQNALFGELSELHMQVTEGLLSDSVAFVLGDMQQTEVRMRQKSVDERTVALARRAATDLDRLAKLFDSADVAAQAALDSEPSENSGGRRESLRAALHLQQRLRDRTAALQASAGLSSAERKAALDQITAAQERLATTVKALLGQEPPDPQDEP